VKGIEGGTLVWDHRLDHSFPQPVTSPSLPYLPSRRRCICHCLVPVRLSSRRPLAGPIVCMCLATHIVSSWFHILGSFFVSFTSTKTTQFLIQVIAQYPPPRPPLSYHLLNHLAGYRVAFYTRSLPSPPCIIIHGRHFMFIHSTLTVPIPRWRNSRGTYLYISHYNITCASFRSCRDWLALNHPPEPIIIVRDLDFAA